MFAEEVGRAADGMLLGGAGRKLEEILVLALLTKTLNPEKP
jgi:hypothetical protein